MSTVVRDESAKIERELVSLRKWRRKVNPLGEIEYTRPEGDWQVQVSKDGWWALCSFTDSDIGDVAVGRFVMVEEGQAFDEFIKAMQNCGLIGHICPYCGDEGGDPITVVSRPYLYGADADGNRGEWRQDEDERCTLCSKPRYDAYDAAEDGRD